MAPTEAEKLQGNIFPLVYAKTGEELRVAALDAGKGLERRLVDLGLPVGVDLRIVQRQGSDRMVVARGPARIALGVGMAHKILVRLAQVESTGDMSGGREPAQREAAEIGTAA